MDLFARVEQRYRFRLPVTYTEFHRRGYLDGGGPRYLKVHEGEWLSPTSLDAPDWSFHPNHRDDILPFAMNGRGDRWCWITSQLSKSGEPPIVLCPREEPEGHYDSPCLIGWIYSVSLSYSAGIWYSPADTRERVRGWAGVVREFGHADWADRLLTITAGEPFDYELGPRRIKEFGFISDKELNQTIADAFGAEYVNSPFNWSMIADTETE